MDRNQAEKISRAADKFAESVRELTQSVDRLAQHEDQLISFLRYWQELGIVDVESDDPASSRWHVLVPRRSSAGLSEKEAAGFAIETVRAVRQELWEDREPEGPAPSAEDLEKWEWMRKERRQREGYEPG